MKKAVGKVGHVDSKAMLFARAVLYLVIYSAIGGVAETLFRLITEHQLYSINGFLHLPIIPIYGIGAGLVILLFSHFKRYPLVVFVGSIVITSILEFVTHWLIEKIFYIRLWDYSDLSYNLDGRISLLNSTCFGIVALLLLYAIHPFVKRIVMKLRARTVLLVGGILTSALLTDIVISTIERLQP